MSYEIAKNISIKKDGRITMSSVSNNVQPRTFETFEILADISDLDEKIRFIFTDLVNGNIQFQPSSKSKVHYGFLKAEKWLSNQNIHIRDLWYSSCDLEGNVFTKEDCEKWKDKAYGVFKNAIEEKISMGKKEYAVSKGGYWIQGLRKYGYTYSSNKKLFTIVHAMAIASMIDGEVVGL